MKKSKKFLSTLAIFGIVAAGSLLYTTNAHAVGVAFYQFSGIHAGGSITSVRSNSWTTSSSNGTITISGWQDAYGTTTPSIADIKYEVVQDEWNGWNPHWVEWRVAQNYTQNGTWYSHIFSGIPNGIAVAIRATVYNGNSTDGAGNAYQSN